MQQKSSRKLLFITWDGPNTNYMEGLFMPIFNAIAKIYAIEFHIIQFTWATDEKIQLVNQLAQQLGIRYSNYPIIRKPHPLIGAAFTVWKGKSYLQRYIKKHQIDIVMPRSTFPALMLNGIKLSSAKIIFDADGLPLEERVDFSGLLKTSLQYRWLKKQEITMLKTADEVITRSNAAVNIHLNTIGHQYKNKFSVVYNGRDAETFKPDSTSRLHKKAELQLSQNEKVFVYCGSLGAQYGWEEMLAIFTFYVAKHAAKWLIITGDTKYAHQRIPSALKNNIIVISVPFIKVAEYLSIADVAFAIRQPLYSMQGVAPIKLGEYLLMGIPTIASKGIGDTENILNDIENCFMYNHDAGEDQINALMQWLDTLDNIDRQKIREQALPYFSINAAAKSYINVLNKLSFENIIPN